MQRVEQTNPVKETKHRGLLSFTSQGALDATQPIFLAAVAFGLATDYGVFLLSRIKEARDGGASDSEAVAVGLERTGRIVTAAAVLFAARSARSLRPSSCSSRSSASGPRWRY